ncbi:calcium-binding protein [Leisingera sp. MMG026]|uniref:calcium-binding protein n=1 Tax=Leisingera sp. MMG026 TaxID=2909982 RepID=UPI001F35F178|nr:calcium-binding protein [Leisingera sp. MMG026]MCF6432524.1 hypothetical protein [Leisingera sp. MMG026]
MPTMTVTGSLTTQMTGLIQTFNGARLTNKYDTGTFLLISNYPETVSLNGYDLRVPGSGSYFITGDITKFRYAEISLTPSFHTIEKLVLDDVDVSAEGLFDLTSRTATTATGKFDLERFQSFVNGKDWTIKGSREDDDIRPGAFFKMSGSETIRAGHGADSVAGGTGADSISGGSGKDVLKGQNGRDTLDGGGGNDELLGGNGRDKLLGGAGNDKLLGGGGNDILVGGNGKDVLRGNKGNDRLDGGDGADLFIFKRGDGHDTIRNFDASEDLIRIYRGASKFSDLEISDTGKGADIRFADVSITLRNFDADDVTADLFVF